MLRECIHGECAHEQHVRRTLTLTHTITAYSVSGNVVRVRILICATRQKPYRKEFTANICRVNKYFNYNTQPLSLTSLCNVLIDRSLQMAAYNNGLQKQYTTDYCRPCPPSQFTLSKLTHAGCNRITAWTIAQTCSKAIALSIGKRQISTPQGAETP